MISVIVPAYNVEKTIERAVNSILTQSYTEIELIVVDDGSTDHTGKIIDEIARRNPDKVISLHTPNQGVTNARLTGVARASGDWIGFVDGDDEIEPDMYELLMSNAEKYHADISHCGYQMVFGDGRVNYFHNTGRLVQQDRLTGLKDLLDGSLVEPGLCNKLFHKTLFQGLLHTGVMDRSIKINEDLLMNYILFSEAEKSVFQDVCKYHYIVRSSSASRGSLNNQKIRDPIRVKQAILDLHVQGMEEPASKAYIGACVNVYSGLMLEPADQFGSEKEQVRNLIIVRRSWIDLLSRKQQFLAKMILSCPKLYRPMYRFYARYLQKNRYR